MFVVERAFIFVLKRVYEFVERARAFGISLPIIPGILPIYNFEKMQDMAQKCGSSVPEFVKNAFADGHCAGSTPLEISSELLKAQVHDLACAGFETIHIYTLNRVPLADVAAETFLNAHKDLTRAVA